MVHRSQQQFSSIWSTETKTKNRNEMLKDIDNLIVLNECNYGSSIAYKLIYYLNDRYNFEYKWITALRNINNKQDSFPFLVLWTDNDSVSPIKIGKTIFNIIGNNTISSTNGNNENYVKKEFVIVANAGHFFMLEKPNTWVSHIVQFIQSNFS